MDRAWNMMTILVPFETPKGIPDAPPGTRLRRIRFRSCPGTDLVLFVVKDVDGTQDAKGVPKDAWWVVRCSDLPDRTMRLFQGSRSLASLLRRYGFLDASGCVNHRDAVAEFESGSLPPHTLAVPPHLQAARGVPQFYPNSGVCWFAALCWSSFANADVRRLVEERLPPEVRALCRRCLFNRDDAEALRKSLWYRYAVGDNVDDPPEMDGRNGFSEFSVLCAKLGVPLLRYHERDGAMLPMSRSLTDRHGARVMAVLPKDPAGERHLLVLRYQDGDHSRFPMQRRIVHDGVRYRLVGLYMGQRVCGHQIGASSPSGDWRDWSLGDADLHKDGIGPIYVYFSGKRWLGAKWWHAWREIVHVTKFGPGNRNFCDLSPHNRPDNSLDKYRAAQRTGSNSVDMVYLSDNASRAAR